MWRTAQFHNFILRLDTIRLASATVGRTVVDSREQFFTLGVVANMEVCLLDGCDH